MTLDFDAYYPFSAIVGQDALKLALTLGAIDSTLGGVLLRGEKGTAKSTAARSLARLLPVIQSTRGCPFHCDPARPWADCPSCVVEQGPERVVTSIPAPHADLPLGATEDRVLGTLDLDRVLKEGRSSLRPGLLAQAHRGILYIDEVNLLPDHLVDVLLDVAASGVNTVQRDGISARHPARFLLVGSMNPEEGELRPQLRDRFGLTVDVAAPTDFESRAEVVRRRLAFERDPQGFSAEWLDADRMLGRRIGEAQTRLTRVIVPDGLLTAIARLCCEAQVDGLRADLALYKAARALAALEARLQVSTDDLRRVLDLVLAHRRRQSFQSPGLDADAIDRALSEPPPGQGMGEKNKGRPPGDGLDDDDTSPPLDSGAPSTEDDSTGEGPSLEREEQILEPGGSIGLPPLPLELGGQAEEGRHAGVQTARARAARGKYLRDLPQEAPRELALSATLRSAVRRSAEGPSTGLTLERGDLHGKQRASAPGSLVVFVVDASGSMGARQRMEMVKSAVLSLLEGTDPGRDRMAVVAFRGPRAEVVLPPGRNAEQAETALRRLPTGGRTPLAHALALTLELLAAERKGGAAVVVLLTDGKGNVPLPGTTGDPWSQALLAASRLADAGVSTVVHDTELGFGRLGRAGELARAMGAELVPLAELSAEAVRHRARLGQPTGRG